MSHRRYSVAIVLSALALGAFSFASAAGAADNTPPGPVTGLTATAQSTTSIKLDWTNPADSDFAGVLICRKQGAVAPTLPCGGAIVTKPTTTFTDSSQLVPNTQYSYSVFAADTSNNKAAGVHASATTLATPPLANVTGLSATPLSSTSIKLDWTNPVAANFGGVYVCRAAGAVAPTYPCGGVNVPKPAATYTDTTNLVPSTQYSYTVFAYTTALVRTSGASISATTAAGSGPSNVTSLIATPLSGTSVKLDWTNPGDANFAGVYICRAVGTVAPTYPCGGVNVAKPTNTYTDTTNVVPNTQYTYSVFAYTTALVKASGANVTTTTPSATAPGNVTGLTATPLSATSIKLDWTNPADSDFGGVYICRAIGPVAPTFPCGGVSVAKPGTTYTDTTALTTGTQYTYTVFAYNTALVLASGTTTTATTP